MSSSNAVPTDSNPERVNNKRWFPLESNPDLMNSYIQRLGFDTSSHKFMDVFSTEDWALEMIPQPVAAVLMLYPITQVQEEFRATERETMESDPAASPPSSAVWFTKQRIGNACGTIGILHALANVPEPVRESCIESASWLGRYYTSCGTTATPEQRADSLENDDEIETMHEEATSDESNQTSRPSIEDCVETHFVALVHVGGILYELDGRKAGPIPHGATTPATLLRDSCAVVRRFMDRDPGEMRFTILALAPNPDADA